MATVYRSHNIRHFITHQGRSVTWLAGALGLGYRYTTRIVNGEVDTSEYIATRISDLLGVPVESLFLPVTHGNSIESSRERVTA